MTRNESKAPGYLQYAREHTKAGKTIPIKFAHHPLRQEAACAVPQEKNDGDALGEFLDDLHYFIYSGEVSKTFSSKALIESAKKEMHIVILLLQVAVALTLLDVWLLRFNQSTSYRGGDARTMIEEFAVYGLPAWSAYFVGALKVGAALCLLIGLRVHFLVFPAALLISVLMIGALAMHWKVRDPLKKSLPAFALLALSVGICLGSIHGMQGYS